METATLLLLQTDMRLKKKIEESYYYASRLVKSSYYLPLKRSLAVHQNRLKFLSPKYALFQVMLKLAQWFWEKRLLNFVKLFYYCFPLEQDVALQLFFSYQDALCQVWLKLVECLKRNRFLDIVNVLLCYYISPWIRAWHFICINLNSIYQRMLCAKFG